MLFVLKRRYVSFALDGFDFQPLDCNPGEKGSLSLCARERERETGIKYEMMSRLNGGSMGSDTVPCLSCPKSTSQTSDRYIDPINVGRYIITYPFVFVLFYGIQQLSFMKFEFEIIFVEMGTLLFY